jgi:hypothetical protein
MHVALNYDGSDANAILGGYGEGDTPRNESGLTGVRGRQQFILLDGPERVSNVTRTIGLQFLR